MNKLKNLFVTIAFVGATVAFASSGGMDLQAPGGNDRGPAPTLDEQCTIDFVQFTTGTFGGTTQYPGGQQNFRETGFCFNTVGACGSLPATFYTYCTDINHLLNLDPYCVEVVPAVVEALYPQQYPAMAWVLTNAPSGTNAEDRQKQLAIWKLSDNQAGGPTFGVPFYHINDNRGYPLVTDPAVFPFVNTIFNTDVTDNDAANAWVLDALGYDLNLDPTFPKNIVNCGDEFLIAADPVYFEGGNAIICATITLVRGAHALNDLNNTAVQGVWVDLSDLNNNGTVTPAGGFTDVNGQINVCISQPINAQSYGDVRLQVCSEGDWPILLFPCPGAQSQSQVVVEGEFCQICEELMVPGDNWLPVELASFTAQGTADAVALMWRTASESNVANFELVRNGATIAEVAARNSATGGEYNYLDRTVNTGVEYTYNLVSVNFDGTREVLASRTASATGGNAVVTEFALYQNYPNPFNPETAIRFNLAEASEVNLSVFNIAGQVVAELANGNFSSGPHTVNFDAANLTSGVYLYRLTAGSFTAQKKMVLMK
ncbi:T9SS type A sorting domain-containing protein [bacterium]|nr:T9SS type A sorting domain-containing protein [bacterium]